jgi:peptidoglycan/xylan/chitin deacetylase (PgdA/CDA1 family)
VRMVVLCYHSIHPTWEDPLAVTPEMFAEHCAWLARHRAVLPLDEIVELEAAGRPRRGVVALTFDDGFADFAEGALPPLLRHRLPTTMFVVAGTLDEGAGGATWLRPQPATPPATLTSAQVLELRELGVRFGSHSWAHRDLRELSEDECVRDLRDSRERLEDLLHEEVPLLAYPYGFHAPHVRSAAAAAGYRYALSLPEGPEVHGSHAAPRVGLYRGNSVTALRVKSSSWYLRARMSPAQPLLRRAAGLLPARSSA